MDIVVLIVMSKIEKQILDALLELDSAVKTMRTASPKPDLQAFFSRIDDLAAQLPAGSDPDLRHYLQRKSYEKARLWLEERRGAIAGGGCGR